MVLLDGEEKVYIPFGKSSYLKGALSNQGTEVAVIICHSWRLFGGSMNDKIILDIVRSFSSSSTSGSFECQRHQEELPFSIGSMNSMFHKQLTTLRFNFPGLLGLNQGMKEMESVIAASNYLLRYHGAGYPKKPRPKRIVLVGYSRGSLISGSASALIPECIGSIYISCPCTYEAALLAFHSSYHLNQSCKRKDIARLFIHGTEDEFTSMLSLMNYLHKFFSFSVNENQKDKENDVTVKFFDGFTHMHKKYIERSQIVKYTHQWLSEKSFI